MPYQLQPFADAGLSVPLLDALIRRHEQAALPKLRTLWAYYRNPLITAPCDSSAAAGGAAASAFAVRRYRLAQEAGLPSRLTGRRPLDPTADDRTRAGGAGGRREIVIENDIAWRIHTMVDFMFGRPIMILSTAHDAALRRTIERALDAVWEASGGISLLQDIGLLGHVYGHVDLLVRVAPSSATPATDDATDDDPALRAARYIRVEVIEPTRGIPLQSPHDFRTVDAYIIRFQRESTDVEPGAPAWTGPASTLRRWFRRPGADAADAYADPTAPRRRVTTIIEILSANHRQVYEDDGAAAPGAGPADRPPRLVEAAPNLVSPGRVPVVHIQNISQPFDYEGLGEVEPLIPLQDELNTRLSDRACRVTLQSFKMYLAKGIDGFDAMPIGPGQLISTDNPDAAIDAFGGDASSPSEDAHVEQVREGMDKASGVPPLASGVVRAKIGNLSSENALKITLMGLLSKTARKRITYGRGIAEASRLILAALDHAGILATSRAERDVRVEWPDPLPKDERQTLAAALQKVELGVPRERVLSELGYAPTDPGLV